MQVQPNYTKVASSTQAQIPGRRGEGIGSKARYLLQLNHLLQTARRMKNSRVVIALSSLIARRGGIG